MDNSSPGSARTWGTPPALLAVLVIGGVVLLVAAALTRGDTAGQLLIGLAALCALGLAAVGARRRPQLTLTDDALHIKGIRGVRRYTRGDVDTVRLVPYPRLGRRVPMIEMDLREPDASERLVILGRWDLGTDPRTVFDELDAAGWVPEGFSSR
ncbi:PH domain-containing protein [Rhodococcoides corynebacterioides]|uniref:PH domain-containing protein n=1 Tax=Rhodococcoides corynebacterioides TaxID=53972 RepID=A0ABS7P3S6_9NOCA|nr:PH domain-containing protein [Rhodococcus corynebacterioides]MBY6367048.1 PH domain-containing protein [Rhodococcus corynebacterioides]MBY6407309.1 PH domain-containing protein [Rhodococcus corynebacterioides]